MEEGKEKPRSDLLTHDTRVGQPAVQIGALPSSVNDLPKTSVPTQLENQSTETKQERKSLGWLVVERALPIAELLSYIALMLGAPAALYELHMHLRDSEASERRERIDATERIYRDVDQRFTDFMKLCLEHPRLDCYRLSFATQDQPPLSAEEQLQQRILYTTLTDVFEVAYTEYHKHRDIPEVQTMYDLDWPGWEAYIKKFLEKKAYRDTWNEIQSGYNSDFQKYVNALIPSPRGRLLP